MEVIIFSSKRGTFATSNDSNMRPEETLPSVAFPRLLSKLMTNE